MSDLLPRNASTQERAMSESIARISAVPTPIRTLWSPQTCPAAFLPWLAWSLSVDEWDANWTDQQKRNAIAASVEIHRRKGTIGALKRALQAIGYEVEINENTGVAYVFQLRMNVGNYGGLTPETLGKLADAEKIALSTKNTRSYFSGIVAYANAENGRINVLSATVDGVTTEFKPSSISNGSIGRIRVFAGAFDSIATTVLPA